MSLSDPGDCPVTTIDVFRFYWKGGAFVGCLTCKMERTPRYWMDRKTQITHPVYGELIFRPIDHDPHCPARNHVYLEGIGPMIEPRAMVFEKEDGAQ